MFTESRSRQSMPETWAALQRPGPRADGFWDSGLVNSVSRQTFGPRSMKRLRDIRLSVKLVITMAVLVVATVALLSFVASREHRATAIDAIVEQARMMTTVASETMASQGESNRRNTRQADSSATGVTNAATDFSSIHFGISAPALREAVRRQEWDFEVTALNARNQRHRPSTDPDIDRGRFREDLLRSLGARRRAAGADEIYAINERTNTVHYLRAIKVSASCLACHGQPGDPLHDANSDGVDAMGFAMEGWSVGESPGAFEVQIPLATLDSQVASFLNKGLIVAAPTVVVSMMLFYLMISRFVGRPLRAMLNRAKSIAEGDLSGSALPSLSDDELGMLTASMNDMQQSLAELVGLVQGAANEVASAATQIAASSEEIALGMEHQQRQTGQVTNAVDEMAKSVGEVASMASEASRKAAGAGRDAANGGDVVSRTVVGMRQISSQVDETASAVSELCRRSDEIETIIGVINEIADQTNLLALNASIEAARAGEHGRGFAVVADEVRKLAERTTRATEEVAESIRTIQWQTTRAVDRMQAGQRTVEDGVSLAEDAGKALAQIVQDSQSIAGMIQSIAAATDQQSASSTQVSRSVEQINHVTNESAVGAREAALAAAKLSVKSDHLQQLVGRFRLR